MKTLVLIDLSGLFRIQYHASEDLEVNEAFSRTVARVRAIASRFDYAAVCCDCGPYLRKAISPSYKAQRDAPPPLLVEQLTRVKERLTADGMLLWECKGYEADDIIATAVLQAAGLDVMIASSDKDALSLVSDTRHVRAMSFATPEKVYAEADVKEKFFVLPDRMPELLALWGDSSDNIPGIKGVGPKRAAALLERFGTFENIFAQCSQIEQPALREAVYAGADAALLARKLVTLYTNAPIRFEDIYERREVKSLTNQKSKLDELEDAIFEPAPAEPIDPMKQAQQAEDAAGIAAAGKSAASAEPTRKPEPTAMVLRPSAPVSSEEWAIQLEPPNAKAAFWLAERIHDSRLFSGSFGNAGAIFAIILRGRSLGIDAVTSLSNFHMIEGRPTMHAALIVGLVLRSGKAEYFDLAHTDDQKATWVTKRKGAQREVTLSFTTDDALGAGLLETFEGKLRGVSKSGKPSNWSKYRKVMLRWRAATELARAVYPDVVTGLYTPDEISDGVHDPQIEAKHDT